MDQRHLLVFTAATLLLISNAALPVFGQQAASSICTSQWPLPPVFAGYCVAPRDAQQAITGGSYTVKVPSFTGGSPEANLTLALAALVCLPDCSVTSLGLIGTGVTMLSSGDDFAFSVGSVIDVNPGDVLTISISATTGGYLLQVQDLTSGATASGVVSTNLRILALAFVMSEIPSPANMGDTLPTIYPYFGSVSITNAQLLVGGYNEPLGAAVHVALNMEAFSGGTISGAIASPTRVAGESFTIVQLATS